MRAGLGAWDCVFPPSTGWLGGAGAGWKGDGDVVSSVGSLQAPSPGLGPAPAARGCVMILQGPENAAC